ncbi:[protein-PII] uridylyltransferase [Maritimibacter sp. 55A14]|uniref:[protein-PII] uridylyltransferase n=1 Tax=Maritimibacter sp. 55A14 TaxID=2174844 RepID=UPI000D60D80B|nr:[protein-PII] uridylyltransferase [Maritimibacter sp. 55A14]PWE31151.1 [protein-PII] uridylyltransferase [Maritimibacter sp. 55A14]
MTLPQEASAPPVSDPADLRPRAAPTALICPAREIFDPDALRGALAAQFEDCADARAIRAAAVAEIGAAYKAGFATISETFRDRPLEARATTSAYSWLTDQVVTAVFWVARRYLHPLPNPTESERLAIFAVGGYGRAEMAPCSDVDLLFLTPWKITPWAESVIESMLYILWDLRLKVGHASRTVKDCVRLGREDMTIRTALLEHRFLDGDNSLAAALDAALWDDLFKGTGREFIEAKLAERDARHEKQGGQRYVLEPNVKEGKGGLRDLQSLFWIAKYLHRVDAPHDLVGLGMFTREEFETFERAEAFLWAVRCHLHLIAGRPMDQLTFDNQVEVAQRLGYEDRGGRREVEHFMQDYFRHATAVGDLTRIFLTALEAAHVKKEPSVVGFLRRAGRRRKLKPGYDIAQGRIVVADETAFLADKLNLLRLFEEALRTGYLIHPDAMRLVTGNLHLIDDELRNDPEATRIFLDLLLKHGNPERSLRRMNELGVLGAFIPEFQNIVAMMQFNMYHHYTVDEHTIQCISNLAEIERGERVEELPIASSILNEGVNRRVLYVALLLHDIGKGQPEDHSILGARIARRLAPRLGLDAAEAETAEWLVRHHLLMSDVAQKRDLSDPRTVRDFARLVKSRDRLNLLLVLTVCDIRGVGPGTWNNWKAVLLRELYNATVETLEGGLEEAGRAKRVNEAKAALRAELGDWPKAALKHECDRHYPQYWQGLDTGTQAVFARLLRDIGDDEIRIELTPDAYRDATRACFALADHPGIFSRLAGALALVGANVVEAKTFTSSDGYATPVFWLQDAAGHPYSEEKLPRLRSMIEKTLKGEVVASTALADRDKLKKRERRFRVPTSITFDNEGSEIYTIIEVDTRDRPGLLHDLTRVLAANNIYIASAVIASYGAQAVDSFYVKDMFGLKLHSQAKRDALERKLADAIAKGAERAQE